MRPEVQLEALAQGRVVDLADLALPRRTRVGDDDIDAAVARGDLVERGAYHGGVRDVAGDSEAHDLGDVAIEHDDFRALARQRLRCRRANARGAAGDHRDA